MLSTPDGHHGTRDGTQVPRASCGYDAWIARAKMKPPWPHCAWPQEPGEQWLLQVLGIKHQTSSWYDLIWLTIINMIYHDLPSCTELLTRCFNNQKHGPNHWIALLKGDWTMMLYIFMLLQLLHEYSQQYAFVYMSLLFSISMFVWRDITEYLLYIYIHMSVLILHILQNTHMCVYTYTELYLLIHMYICMCIWIYIHTYIHTLHYITLHYITFQSIPFHSITLHYITLHLHYITLHYITLHYVTSHYIHTYITLHYVTLHCTTLHYITLHYITLHYITLRYITLHYKHTYIKLHYITLHYIPHKLTNLLTN